MAPLATAFVVVLPNMAGFAPAVATGIRGANMAAAGTAAGGAFGKGFSSSASKLMGAGLIVGLGMLVKKSVEAAGDFEASMIRLVTSAGETGNMVSGNLKLVADGIKDMAGQVGTSSEELAKAIYTVEQGSFHGAQALLVLRAAAEGAKAEQTDLAKVANAVTTALVDYHLKGEDAALVTSKMVAATSVGKSTFEQFTSSLHSVLPAASAAGISLDDILAALSSMTIHGYSAQQATQNLADVIRHMQNPTNVQAKELALLGLTTNQLAEDLKSKGLTGTLQMISDRIQKMMPPGSQKVILDLQTALSKLSPKVQELGKQLLLGQISYIEYRKAARDLTPIQASQAMSFATLAGATHRIGDEQMSASKTMQVYSQALAKATGDATGMNVALMLTGANAYIVKNNIAAISGAATEAGNHVKGWGEIQETFNFKISALKAELHTTAITLGEVLLPTIGHIVEKITEVIEPMSEWIEHHKELTTRIMIGMSAFLALGTAAVLVSKLVSGLALLSRVLGITAAAQWLLNAAVGTNVVITSAAEAKIAAYLVMSRIAAVATKAWAAATWLLNAAMSPWGLIVIAIVAVVAALVYAYFHFDGFRKVVDKAMKGAMVAIKAWWEYAKMAFEFYRALIMDYVVPAMIWLWQKVIVPAFNGIVIAIKAWWEYAKMAFGFWKAVVETTGAVIMWLWRNVAQPAFTGIAFVLKAWWVIAQVVFELVKLYVENYFIKPLLFAWDIAKIVWKGISAYMELWWAVAKAVFTFFANWIDLKIVQPVRAMMKAVEPIWRELGRLIEAYWNERIKPTFQAVANFVTKTLPDAFEKGTGWMGKAWDKLKGIMSAPVNAVIRFVLNDGIIKGWNTIAGWVGVKDRIPNIPQINLADGGSVGQAAGRIYGFGGPRQDNIPIMASAGEYIIPANVVKDMGVGFFDGIIGRNKPMYPGDGSQGISIGRYADGGLVDFITSPANWVGGKMNGLVDKIPGGGGLRNVMVGGTKKLITGLINWAKSKVAAMFDFGNSSSITPIQGSAAGIMAWLRAQNGKPYGWAQAGPSSYDCSGIVSAVWNLMHGVSPYRHTFSTSGQGLFFGKRNQYGVLTAGWANPGERGGGSVGHTAGSFLGLGFESTGSRGVRVGPGTTPVTSFAHWGTFDRGGRLRPGMVGVNLGRGEEMVSSADDIGRMIAVMERLVDQQERVIAAVDRVAPGVGRELNGTASTLRQMARSR